MPARTLAVVTLALGLLACPLQPALGACNLVRVAELPISMENLQPLITAGINGTELPFVLDSGAFWSLITPQTASELKLRLSPPPAGLLMNALGGTVSLSVTTISTLTFVGVPLHNVQFVVGGTDISGTAGLLGQNVLETFDVEYDLANGTVRLWRPRGRCHRTILAYWVKVNQPFSMVDIAAINPLRPQTVSRAYINGKRIHVVFDTGSATSLLSLRAAARAGVRPSDPGVRRAGFSSGLGESMVPAWIAPFASVKIGDEEIRNTHLRIADLSSLTLLGADMLVGADFFLSHRIYVANSQRRLYFTYNGGPVFNLTTQPTLARPGTRQNAAAARARSNPSGSAATGSAGPSHEASGSAATTDAAGLGRLGAAYLSRRDFGDAIADLTRASQLDPKQPQYFYDRARAYLGNGQPRLAMADLDQSIKLRPDDVPALVTRAQLLFRARRRADAIADLDAADRAAPQEADVRLSLATLYLEAGLFPQTVAQLDLWIPAHQDDALKGQGLLLRCRARALEGQDLGNALSDCNNALDLLPSEARWQGFETRGLVQLRRGEVDRALSDYNRSLRLHPGGPWALYGRGLAEIHKGMSASGRADIAAARARAPRIDALFRDAGIVE